MQDDPGQPEIVQRGGTVWLALTLAWVAGFVDLFGYLLLVKIFTSHMSGNSVAMMADIVQSNWKEAIRHGSPIPAFILGVFITALLSGLAKRKRIRRRLSMAISFEITLIAILALYQKPAMHMGPGQNIPDRHFWIASAILAMAMGVQSAALRQVWGKPVHTAFITGMLTHFAENAAELLLTRDGKSNKLKDSHSPLAFMLLDGGVWCAFVIGAACGGIAELRWGLPALGAPVCVLIFIVIWDFIRPVPHGAKRADD